MKHQLFALIAICSPIVFAPSTPVRADGVIKTGSESCGWDQVIIYGVNEIKVEKETDGIVDVSDPRVSWRCHNSNGNNRDGAIDCPPTTNRFNVHRQKRDNDEWLFECRVKG